MKKKIGIITLHRVVNYGSVLQAYALQEVIKSFKYDVEVIDYYPSRLTMYGMLKRIKNKNEKFKKNLFIRNIARIIIFPSYIIRFLTFKKFIKKYIRMTEKTFYDVEQFENCNLNYDIYCTGSDQVWNSEWNEKVDKPMFLSFAPEDKKKIAYAASFGKDKLNQSETEITTQLLNRYDKISVREKSGVDIINSLGIPNSVHNVDPTLLLNSHDWRRIASSKYEKDKYIFVYNLNRNKKIDAYAENLSKKTGLKIRYLSYQLHEFYKKGKMCCNCKVEDFLSLIDNAKYVITDSFHATAFSINFNVQFVIVYPDKFSTRLQSLLELCNLENRIAKDENDVEIIDRKIDYKKVDIIIQKERVRSLNWLKDSLSR